MMLGLDLATKTGWCLIEDGEIVLSGVQDFSKRRGESNGLMFLRFRKWLLDLVTTWAPKRPQVIAFEMAHMRGASTEILLGLQTHTQSTAAELGIESAPVHTATLKKFACGSGRAGKPEMMAKAAEILGRSPQDDNEADAVHVARWAEAEFLSF